jgi:hypothetical protein
MTRSGSSEVRQEIVGGFNRIFGGRRQPRPAQGRISRPRGCPLARALALGLRWALRALRFALRWALTSAGKRAPAAGKRRAGLLGYAPALGVGLTWEGTSRLAPALLARVPFPAPSSVPASARPSSAGLASGGAPASRLARRLAPLPTWDLETAYRLAPVAPSQVTRPQALAPCQCLTPVPVPHPTREATRETITCVKVGASPLIAGHVWSHMVTRTASRRSRATVRAPPKIDATLAWHGS